MENSTLPVKPLYEYRYGLRRSSLEVFTGPILLNALKALTRSLTRPVLIQRLQVATSNTVRKGRIFPRLLRLREARVNAHFRDSFLPPFVSGRGRNINLRNFLAILLESSNPLGLPPKTKGRHSSEINLSGGCRASHYAQFASGGN